MIEVNLKFAILKLTFEVDVNSVFPVVTIISSSQFSRTDLFLHLIKITLESQFMKDYFTLGIPLPLDENSLSHRKNSKKLGNPFFIDTFHIYMYILSF
jgi:hypothetical protein